MRTLTTAYYTGSNINRFEYSQICGLIQSIVCESVPFFTEEPKQAGRSHKNKELRHDLLHHLDLSGILPEGSGSSGPSSVIALSRSGL